MAKKLRKLVLLHSNDIHGQFTGEVDENGKLSKSFAQTSGYVNKIKAEEENVLYCVAGDVFQGSLIDSDFQGLSTTDILNMASIDLMSLGNHELDYGIGHMMFVDRIAHFPILNANFKAKNTSNHLFKPYHRVKYDDFNVMFIGLLTKNIVDQTKAEGLVGTYVTVEDACEEVERIVQRVRAKEKKVDFIVLMTHIGYEADLELAAKLDPSLGVNVILGAHSHTYPKECKVINDILVVQAGMENTHIGRLDLMLDLDNGKVDSWDWEMIPIDEEHCPLDRMTRAMIATYALDIDEKYSGVVTRFSRNLDNFGRGNITEVGQVITDGFRDSLPVDVFMLAASSMRCYSMEMTVTLQDIREAYPYDGKLYSLVIDGAMLRKMIKHYLRDEVIEKYAETFYQQSSNLKIEFDRDTQEILNLTLNGEELKDDQQFTIGMQEFYMLNCEIGLGMKLEELTKYGEPIVVSQDAFGTIRDYLRMHPGLGGPVDDRLIMHKK